MVLSFIVFLLIQFPLHFAQISAPSIEHSILHFFWAKKSETSSEQIAQNKPILLLFYSSNCPYSLHVLDYLRKIHKKVPMRNVQNNPQAKEELRSVGGKMLVPCLIVDGEPLYESGAIIQWLSEHQDLLDPS